ncbi:MAG: alpha/beta hydrolase, partial [Rhodanobacter sp.]
MKLLVVAAGLLVACASVQAKTTEWQPSAGHTQIPIWPGVAPDLKPVPGPETVTRNTKDLIGGLPVTAV